MAIHMVTLLDGSFCFHLFPEKVLSRWGCLVLKVSDVLRHRNCRKSSIYPSPVAKPVFFVLWVLKEKNDNSPSDWSNTMSKEQKRQINQFLQSGLSNCQNHDIPINERYALSVREAASYFNIGTKKIRRLADENLGNFAFCCGNRYLIIRKKFEEYLQNTSSV